MTDRKLLDRVRKLLTLAADTSSPKEAAIAARRVAHLIEQHHLSQAEVIQPESIGERIGQSGADATYRRVPRWYEMLAAPVARLFDCAVRFLYRPPTGQGRMVFLGLDDDAQVASWTLDYLTVQIKQLTQIYQAQHRDAHRRCVNDFRMGAAWSIRSMLAEELALKEEARAQQASPGGKSLMVRRRELVEEFCQIEYTPLCYNQRDSDAYQAGCDAGRDVTLRQGVDGSQTTRLA